MKHIYIIAILLAGCSSGLSLGGETPVDDAGVQSDTIDQNDTLCQVTDIGQIHSWNALIALPDGASDDLVVYLDNVKLKPVDDWYIVYNGPGVNPPGDYLYIRKRGPGDHTVSVAYGCVP